MRTPFLESKSLASLEAVLWLPEPATSVLVTTMSAQEQRKKLESKAMKGFIIS